MARVVQPVHVLLVYACLSVTTLISYWPLTHHGFSGLDDPTYITRNPQVQAGLSWANVAWAWHTHAAGNWHPLTWLSHMLDVQLFGLAPGWHHGTNLLLHVVNTLLLLTLLRRLTGKFWPSALVAGLFALHPLHVESVAWAAERKDVLSTCFFLLTLLAYAKYAGGMGDRGLSIEEKGSNVLSSTSPHSALRTPRPGLWYALSLCWFALGLMSKPMVVTAPCVMLLLDYWPLGRLESRSKKAEGRNQTGPTPRAALSHFYLPHSSFIILEKLPFFALAAIGSVLTFQAQHHGGSVVALPHLSFTERLGNAVTAYVLYLSKTFWPADLAVFYPHPALNHSEWPAWQMAVAALLLAAVSAWALVRRKQEPWLVTGWFWFLGTLVPALGLVQVGSQGMADRYTYIPLIGIFVCLAWSVDKLATAAARPRLSALAALTGAVGLVACTLLTRHQVNYWANDRTLFEHALAVEERNPFVHGLVATALMRQGQYGFALTHGRAALQSGVYDPLVLGALGDIYTAMGHTSEAIHSYQKAVEMDPRLAPAWYQLGCLYSTSGNRLEAVRSFRAALARAPEHAVTHRKLAESLWALGQQTEALSEFAEAVRLAPSSAENRFCLGVAQTVTGSLPEATIQLAEAVRLQPTHALAHEQLGLVLMRRDQFDEALIHLREAARLAPAAESYYNLGLGLALQGQLEEAVRQYRRALELGPNVPATQNDLAWILATAPQDQLRNGAEAVRLAESAWHSTGDRNARFLGTLAAAYAEAGRFNDAVQAAETSRALALTAGDKTLAADTEARLALYRQQHPYRQPPPARSQPQ